MDSGISVRQLNKTFGNKHVLHDMTLEIPRGSMVALIGASGSGKSTLLRHLAGLEKSVRGLGGEIYALSHLVQSNGQLDRSVRQVRAEIGYIFQQFNLVNRLSVLRNVLLGRLGRISRWKGSLGLFGKDDLELAYRSLDRVGLLEHAFKRASQLSGGQQQRVAIAKTLCQQAQIILADEPIASLDPKSARKVMNILSEINRRDKKTVVVTLHQVDYAFHYCENVVALRDGYIHYAGPISNLTHEFLNDLYGSELESEMLFADSGSKKASGTNT